MPAPRSSVVHLPAVLLCLLTGAAAARLQPPQCPLDLDMNPWVRIVSVHFTGNTRLPESELRAIARSLTSTPVCGRQWQHEAEQRVQYAFQRRGYFKAMVDMTPTIVRESDTRRDVKLEVEVDAGEQYRLKTIQLRNATVFSAQELRRMFPLADGDIVDGDKIRQWLEALRRAYGERGYINFTPVPDAKFDDDQRLVILAIDLDQGQQFHVGSFEVLGLEPRLTAEITALIKPGDVYSPSLLEAAWRRYERYFPRSKSFRQNSEMKTNNDSNTLSITWDLRNR